MAVGEGQFALPARERLVRLGELAVVLLLSFTFSDLVKAVAGAIHLPLPEMPLLHRTYLLFIFVLLVLWWVRFRGETLASLGLVRPASWPRTIALGFAIFFVVMAFDLVGRPLIDPLVAHATGTQTNLAEQHFAPLKGNLPMLLYLVPVAWLFGGFGEEMLHRGFIMTRIAQVLGESRWAWTAAVFLQAIPFALGHAYQGPVGVVAIYFVAVITGAGTVIWGRNLWPAIIAHGLQDTLGFVAFYTGIVHA
jgi:membrane protease YdiL (CAAX protease family)